jgi:hypothetical protein
MIWSNSAQRLLAAAVLFFLAQGMGAGTITAQESRRLFPQRDLLPTLLAGPRDPVTSFSALAVPTNPNAYGTGPEVEVALGLTLPVLLLSGADPNPVVVGLESAAFARFGLQVLERELVATDWVFAIPVVWHREKGWIRFRYYHTSSHMGDEYARRFQEPGVNFARDAAELSVLRRLGEGTAPSPWGVYGSVRFAYNVHPEESERWVARAGTQWDASVSGGRFPPFAAVDVEWDQDAGDRPRLAIRGGVWLPEVAGRRALRVSLGFLTGPSPLGQFNGLETTQFGLSLQGNF